MPQFINDVPEHAADQEQGDQRHPFGDRGRRHVLSKTNPTGRATAATHHGAAGRELERSQRALDRLANTK